MGSKKNVKAPKGAGALVSPKGKGIRSTGFRQQAYQNVEKVTLRPPPATERVAPTPTPPKPPRSKMPLYISGVGFYCLIVYGAYVYITNNSEAPVLSKPLDEQKDTSYVYDEIAPTYDSGISTSEFWMGLPLLRRWMVKKATGDVLESSAGTGRNMKYYNVGKLRSITFVDTSSPMLEVAKQAFKEYHQEKWLQARARFVIQDAAAPMRTPSGDKFDTVIQSMGICSHRSPVQLLRSLGDACKPEGTIILLEHGRSHYDWLNRILDRYADKHADTWGCWWNRDIEGIVGQSGLKVLKVKRYHLGTTYWIEAQPPSSGEKRIEEVE